MSLATSHMRSRRQPAVSVRRLRWSTCSAISRSRANWGARNTSYVERDSAVRLHGYDDRARVVEVPDPRTGKPTYTIRYDYRELVPLLRHRYEPEHPEVAKVMNRQRDVRMSIDSRLQVQVGADPASATAEAEANRKARPS